MDSDELDAFMKRVTDSRETTPRKRAPPSRRRAGSDFITGQGHTTATRWLHINLLLRAGAHPLSWPGGSRSELKAVGQHAY